MQKIKINWSQVFTASVITAIGTAFALVRLSDSLNIRVVALESENTEIKANIVPRNEFELFTQQTNTNFENIGNQLDRMESRL